MHFSELNDDNHMIFAIKHYNNPQAVTQEDFFDDMKKFKYIKRLLKKYKKSGVLRTHLLINHFITIYNLFGEAATPLLFYKIEPDLWPVMKTFIVTLGRLPDVPKCFVHEIPIDPGCYRELKSVL